jgi:myo-inositol catabolism protein IolS
LMGYGSLAHGLLTGTFDHNTSFASTDWRSRGVAFNMPLFTKENFPRNLRAVADLKEIATHMGIELYHLALAWVLSNPVLSVALVGARSAGEVDANMGALKVEFSEADLQAIDRVFARHNIDTRPDIWVE